MKNDLVSIIVPVYNTAEYLRDCLDSLVIQTYENIEIVLVENGSTDNTLDICKEYANKYPKIRLFQEGIRKQGTARNRGLTEMRGTYFCFVDGDDFVSENYVKYMYDAIKKYDADLVQCGVVFMLECRDEKKDITNNVKRISDKKELNGHVWGKLYRSSKYKDVRFSDARMGSDAIYSNELFKISTDAVICGYRLYGYRSYQGSVTRIVPNKSFFSKLDRCINEKKDADYHYMIQKCIQVVRQRREEQLYHNELLVLRKKIDQAAKASMNIDSDLRESLEKMIKASEVSKLKSGYLKLKHKYTTHTAMHRQKINYHCRLD